MKLEHLIRDCHFTLKTDHKNLTFINTDFRGKVKRWKLAIQHFDFDIEYIKGEDNIVGGGWILKTKPTTIRRIWLKV